jgi:hypothetical protein
LKAKFFKTNVENLLLSASAAAFGVSKQHVNRPPAAKEPGPEKIPALDESGFSGGSFYCKLRDSIRHLPGRLGFLLNDYFAIRNYRETSHLLFKLRSGDEAWLCPAASNLLQRQK